MRFLVDWVFRRLTAIEPTGMEELEQLEILARLSDVPGFDKFLRALISTEIKRYFDFVEDQKEMRWITKGSVLRMRWIRREMEAARDKLNKLKDLSNAKKTEEYNG